MNEKRGHWYLLTGILLGVIVGLVIAQFITPPISGYISPSELSSQYRSEYRLMIARAYLANNDLVRTNARLDLLQEVDVIRILEEQAQRAASSPEGEGDAQSLAKLAADLRQDQ